MYIYIMDFPGSSDGKMSACNVEDPGAIPGSGRSPGEGNGNPRQFSCLENSMDGGRLQSMGLQSRTRLSSITFTFAYIYIYPLRFFSHIGHYRVLSRVPCIIQ